MSYKCYKCDRCGKSFDHKNDWRRHKNRKRACKISAHNLPIKLSKNSPQNDRSHECQWCHKTYKRNYHLTRHLDSYCKAKKDFEQNGQKGQNHGQKGLSDKFDTGGTRVGYEHMSKEANENTS